MDDDALRLTFDGFEIDCEQRQLRRDGEAVDLGSRYFDALVLLARNPGELISKERFMTEVWRGVPVTDEALTQCIRTLRRALGEDASDPRYIRTVPKHGYRFIATVRNAPCLPPVRQGSQTVAAGRLVGATAVGGAAAGALAGGVYAALATAGAGGGAATIVVLSTILGLLGATGIGFGMALSSLWKGRRSWAVVAGGAGRMSGGRTRLRHCERGHGNRDRRASGTGHRHVRRHGARLCRCDFGGARPPQGMGEGGRPARCRRDWRRDWRRDVWRERAFSRRDLRDDRGALSGIEAIDDRDCQCVRRSGFSGHEQCRHRYHRRGGVLHADRCGQSGLGTAQVESRRAAKRAARSGTALSVSPSRREPVGEQQCQSIRRTVFSSSGRTEMRTVSPELPGKSVNIASTRLGTRYCSRFEVDSACALPSNRRSPFDARSIFMSIPLV
ncbi:MAG: hypothetical protein DI637_07395 [Citromicrobium sp.]|nr:MAG: hypothetical protein DI637_07395 [Citromicrobium sp.]